MEEQHGDISGGLGAGECGDGGALCGGGAPVGAKAGAGDGRAGGGLAAGLWSWYAGPYGDLPINFDGTYSDAEIDSLTDQWNRYYFGQFFLAKAGALMRGSAGAAHAAEMGVSHGAA